MDGWPPEPVTASDGTRLSYHAQRPTTYSSVFGQVRFARHAFTAPGQEGCCLLDAELSLPARCNSDLLREWAVDGAIDASYRESRTVLARILGVSLSLQAIETAAVEAEGEVATFYDQPTEPVTPSPAATILVVQADGKGGPVVQPATQEPSRNVPRSRQRLSRASPRLAPTSALPMRALPPCCRIPVALSQPAGRSP